MGELLGTLGVKMALEAKQFIRDAERVRKTLDRMGRATTALGRKHRRLSQIMRETKVSLNVMAAAATAAAAAFGAFKVGQQAAQFQDAARIFKQAGGDIENLRAATRGMVSDFDLVKKANLARTMGIDQKAVARFAQIADAAARTTGQGFDYLFDSIVTGSARQSKMILDNLGIMISAEDANKKYAKALGKTVEALTDAEKKQAFLNEVMEQGQSIIDGAGDAATSNATAYGTFTAAVKNMATAFGKFLQPAIQGVLGKLTELANELTSFFNDAEIGFKNVGGYRIPILVNKSDGGADKFTKDLVALGAIKESYQARMSSLMFGEAGQGAGAAAEVVKILSRIAEIDAQIAQNLRGGAATYNALGTHSGGGGGGGGGGNNSDAAFKKMLRETVADPFFGRNESMATLTQDQRIMLAMSHGVPAIDNTSDAPGVDAVAMPVDQIRNVDMAFEKLNDGAQEYVNNLDALNINTPDLAEAQRQAKIATQKLAEAQLQAARDMASAIVTIGQALMSGGGGQAIGNMAGSAIGGAVGTALGGPGGGVLGQAIGGLIGGTLGSLIDEVVNVLGILTPVFDALAIVIRALHPIFIVVGMFLKEFAQSIELLAPLLFALAEPVAGLLLIFVRLTTVAFAVGDTIMRMVTMMTGLFSAAAVEILEWIDGNLFMPMARAVQSIEALVANANNAMLEQIRQIPGMDNFGMMMDVPDPSDITSPFADFATGVEQLRNWGEEQASATRDNTAAIEENNRLQSRAENLRPGFKLTNAQYNAIRAGEDPTVSATLRMAMQSRYGSLDSRVAGFNSQRLATT